MAKRFVGIGLWAALGTFALSQACGSAEDGGIAGGDGGVSAGGKGGGSAASGATSGSGGGLILEGGPGDGSLTDANACATETQKAEPLPLDIYIMLDKSGSMLGTKWTSTVSAINSFVNDAQSAGIGVGLDFFPDNPECSIGTYSTPSVPIAILPGNATNISGALSSTGPSGGTPTLPAMQGALSYAQTHAIKNPDHVVVIVLATDGQPNDCSSSVGGVSGIAQQGVNGSPKILTFVIGVGSALSNLNQIAQAGGTNSAFIVDTSGNVGQQFIDALNAIRGAALACEYLIPKPQTGTVDPTKVNVTFTPDGGQPETWPKYANEAACPPTGNGWYYDNDISPTKILLCPGTCSMVKNTKGQVDVLFGCATKGPA
ncbi:MAG: VWA domain-containing protein [Myxococcales bacterium]|nr:VWA domain-containing protein [Myxococcales bacterium]